jgi:hypothetical protein
MMNGGSRATPAVLPSTIAYGKASLDITLFWRAHGYSLAVRKLIAEAHAASR